MDGRSRSRGLRRQRRGSSVRLASHSFASGHAARIRFLSVEPLLADLGPLDLRGIDWVIVGGESGPHARPMLRAWVTPIRRACRAQGVPFFFKQWGGIRKHKTGRTLDGRTYDEFPVAFDLLRKGDRHAETNGSESRLLGRLHPVPTGQT